MPTIHDVAARAGVSVATVSRWLGGQHVRAAAAVEQAVGELGYRVNHSAQSLKTGRHSAIGVVVPDVTNPFFAAVVKGLERALVAATSPGTGRMRLLLAHSDESADREAEILADLTDRVDGFILAPATEQDRSPLDLARAGVPVVLLDRDVTGGELCDVVLADNVAGAASAARHLLDLGHTRIAMINGPADTTPGRERRTGFLEVLTAAGLPAAPDLDLAGDFHEESGRTLTRHLLELPEPPTALFTANNQMTVGALRAVQELGVRVPEDLSVVGFDDLVLGQLLEPPLTCVTRDEVAQGEIVMRLLLDRLSGQTTGPAQRVVLGTHLEVRGSTAAPPHTPQGAPR